jgi:hypothetical protein
MLLTIAGVRTQAISLNADRRFERGAILLIDNFGLQTFEASWTRPFSLLRLDCYASSPGQKLATWATTRSLPATTSPSR